jgi:hypothetical protein
MKTFSICEACKKPVILDPRQINRQRFCPNANCQRARRRQNQRLRRTQAQGKILSVSSMPMVAPSGMPHEAAMKPHEATLMQLHPIIIGLISQFIDSNSQEDILFFLRRCAARGQDILFPPDPKALANTLNSKPKLKYRAPGRLKAT